MSKLKTKAFSLLARRSYFSKELAKKLIEKGFPPKDIEELIQELKERGWINDEELSQRLVQKMHERGYGSRAIAFKLKEKGGSLETPIEESPEGLIALIQKKYARHLPQNKDKVIRALLRRGFSYELISKVLH